MAKRIPCTAAPRQNPGVAKTFSRAVAPGDSPDLFHFQDQPVLDYSFFEDHVAAYAEQHIGGAIPRR
jgi:hypothetical protein